MLPGGTYIIFTLSAATKFIIIWSAANRDDDLAPAGVRQTQYAIIWRLGLVRLVSLISYHLATLFQTVISLSLSSADGYQASGLLLLNTVSTVGASW